MGGLFTAARRVRERAEAHPSDLNRLDELRVWFNLNLEKPRRFNRSRRPHRKEKALSWFKDTALEHLRMAREMAAIVVANGEPIREVHSDRPGYIVYEDDHQVVAEPFNDSGC